MRLINKILYSAAVVGVMAVIAVVVVVTVVHPWDAPQDPDASKPTVTWRVESRPHLPVASQSRSRLQQPDLSEFQKVMALQRIEGIDQKMNYSEFTAPPPGTRPDAFDFGVPFARASFSDRRMRLLNDENDLSQPGIITFNNQSSYLQEYYAYTYIFNNLEQYSSQFVVYPYAFTYSPDAQDSSQDVTFQKGGVFVLNSSNLPNDTSVYNYFNNIKAVTDVKFGKAKALYDINIAVLDIEGYFNEVYKDLTYESSTYCNFLATYLGKYTDCLSGSDYIAFKKDSSNAGKTALAMLGVDDIVTSGLLFATDGSPRFQLLIIPDHYAGAHTLINSQLGTTGQQLLRNFVSRGGFIYATGKSGYLLELWNILPTGMYDTTQYLTTINASMVEPIIGCDSTSTNFTTRLLCMNLTDGENNTKSFLLSAYMLNTSKLENMTVVMKYDNTSTTLKKKDSDGFTNDLTTSEMAYQPFAIYTTYGKGKVYVVNGNPLYKGWFNAMFYNMMFLAMSRNVLIDAYVGSSDGKPIPGGECGIDLDVKITVINLYDTNVTDMGLHLWFPNYIVPTSLPSTCASDSTNLTSVVDTSSYNASSHIKCGTDLLTAFEHYTVTLKVEITDAMATQQKYDIVIVEPVVNYTDSETGLNYIYDMGGLKTDAALAALLRASINPDPSSFYPIAGRGQYVDNVLEVENKEDTSALDVEYIGMVPIVSPVVDGSDQTAAIELVNFLASYYNNSNHVYYYPFENVADKNYDYLDYLWLNGKGVVLVAEWDIAAKRTKLLRNEAFPEVDSTQSDFDIQNVNYTGTINSLNYVMKQIYYANADNYFDYASQRQMVFVDTSTVGGAAAYYPNGIPDGIRDTNKATNVAKKILAWARSDLYFYSTSEYQMPTNVNYTQVISIDRYPKYNGSCVKTFGDATAIKEVTGYFSIAKGGLKPNEYSNELLMYCEKNKVWLDDAEKVTNGSIKKIHYLVPVTNDGIDRADDIMDFVSNTDGTGYLDGYPEVQFIYAHYFNIYVSGDITRQGGRMEIALNSDTMFKNETYAEANPQELVTYSADQVAFYKTTYNASTRVITGYFKRGLMPNEAYGKTSFLGIMIEGIDMTTNGSAHVKIYQMKYDISEAASNYETFSLKAELDEVLIHSKYFSLPAAEVHVKVNRNNKTSIYAYELMDPYTRFGVYIQELQAHRTIWSSAESHHTTGPGLQAISGGFSTISNLGISSVPFVEYVTTGRALLIPSSPTTSRVTWYDIWGREWVQPLRSVFPDVPPLPGPLLNFMMTTTFEMTKTGTTTRVLEWNSMDTLDLRVHIKLLNNYPKYFTITSCKDNAIPLEKTSPYSMGMTFDASSLNDAVTTSYAPNSSFDIDYERWSVYGVCFDEEGTVLKGSLVDATTRSRIATAYLCAETANATKMLECNTQYADLPTVTKRTNTTDTSTWIYSPEVDRYHPKNYISSSMWDMTHSYYDDSVMTKSFPYHMDNNLPGLDVEGSGNPPTYKLNNVIAQPIYKGCGFNISYSKTKTLARFPKYKGWWSDNLQNKDHTLLAGQSQVNNVSVDKDTLLPQSAWINAHDIVGSTATKKMIAERLKNIHTCLYNQHRIRTSVNQTVFAFPSNVFQNNIIPIIPDLESNDDRLTNYNCTGVYQYSPYNISEVDNIVQTGTIRDWLYFGANLRGEALETINVPMTLMPYGSVKYEGMAKVQDGGRFVYWNPANGPNSFLIVDDVVNVVTAKRCDITIASEVFPKTTTTFNPVLYHLFTITDANEVNRQWTYDTYTNHYGFGDSVVSIFVGGTDGTVSMVDAGDYTIAKITFFNNAGFDWNMYGSAIDFEYLGTEPINANDLLTKTKHTIQAPLKYNFLIATIPSEIQSYIAMAPSLHTLEMAPQYFDFTNNNVATIRDGFIGNYFYRINISDTLPDSIRGKVYEITLALNQSCFDRLPGYNDPTGTYHDYTLQIPPIKIAIPYKTGTYAGKAFYTLGYSHSLYLNASLPKYWTIQDVRVISEEKISSLRLAAADSDTYDASAASIWNSLSTSEVIPIYSSVSGTENTIMLDLSQAYPTFPLPNGTNPDIALTYLLMKCNTSQLDYGKIRVLSSPTIYYTDFANNSRSAVISAPVTKTVTSKGAWLEINYDINRVSVTNATYTVINDQRIFSTDTNVTIQIEIITQNTGTDVAYNVNMTVIVAYGLTIIEELLPKGIAYNITVKGDSTVLTMYTKRSFAAGDKLSEMVYVKYRDLTSTKVRRLLTATTASVACIESVSADIDLKATSGVATVSQSIDTPLTVSVITSDKDTVSLAVATSFVNYLPTFKVTATPTPTLTLTTNKAVRSILYRQIVALDCEDNTSDSAHGLCSSISMSEVTIKSVSATMTATDSPIASTFTGTVRSGQYKYRVETYDENMLLLAESSWTGVAQRPSTSASQSQDNTNGGDTKGSTDTSSNGSSNNSSNGTDVSSKGDNSSDSSNNTSSASTSESSAYSLPLWAIILIPVGAFAVIMTAAILIYRKYRLVKIHMEPGSSQDVVIDISKENHVATPEVKA